MSKQECIRIVREMVDAWNARDVARYAKVLDSGCTLEWTAKGQSAPGKLHGSEAACDGMREWLAAFPDLRLYVEGIACSGDRVLTSWLATGTREGKRLAVPAFSVVHLRTGKVASVSCCWDTDQMLRHLPELRRR